MKESKTICVDFDGCIARYEGYKGKDVFGDPVGGVQNALQVLKENGYTIIVFTTRKADTALKKYLKDNDITYDYINENPNQPDECNTGKPIADIYLDDRAICFRGEWKYTLENIATFKPYNSDKKDEKVEMEDAFKRYQKMSQDVKICGPF